MQPPKAPRPDETPSYPDKNYRFDTLGVRIPTLLISPWIKKGTVVSAPPKEQMPFADSKYDLTSIMATARKLLPGMGSAPPLTKRDAWAATFEHVFSELDAPRTDCPLHLPDAAAPAKVDARGHAVEGTLLLNDLQRDIAGVHAHLASDGEDQAASQAHMQHMQQRDLGAWMQAKYAKHSAAMRKRALRLQLPSANWTVSCRPTKSPGWLDTFKVQCGGTGTGVFSPCTSSFQTISTSKLEHDTGSTKVKYCLRWSNSSSALHVAPCDPSNVPSTNRDASQHWNIVTADGTVHPFGRADLCLTNAQYNHGGANETQYLEFTAKVLPCNGGIQQHWAYGGNGGALVYGSCTSLGLV